MQLVIDNRQQRRSHILLAVEEVGMMMMLPLGTDNTCKLANKVKCFFSSKFSKSEAYIEYGR